ncbi:MAG: hypothetical protein RMI34_06005 [Chloroherpetonaceae bacterium]|nr:hypothetical protein [Chloroherpetonaceae bacterium]MDW8019612.1 hypothetical protein [Chloroherpetonaceae bacterium]
MSASRESCQTCLSTRLIKVTAKTSEYCLVEMAGQRRLGSVPNDMNIGGDEYLEFQYCLDCGQVQGRFPLPTTELERQLESARR